MSSNDEFYDNGVGHAVNADRANLGSLTLAQAGESYTDQVMASARRPNSVLAPLAFSGEQSPNGTAGEASHWQAGLGVIGSANAMSPENFEQNQQLRFFGHDENAELD